MGEMTTGLAHEINQPLAAISLYAQAAERFASQAAPNIEEVVGALRRSAPRRCGLARSSSACGRCEIARRTRSARPQHGCAQLAINLPNPTASTM
jgi:signal transduction histidine kinase